MKKKLFITLGIIICLSYHLKSQFVDEDYETLDEARLEIIYKLTYSEDSTNINHKASENMILLLGNNISFFQSYRSYKMAIIIREKYKAEIYTEWSHSNDFKNYVSRFQYAIYKNHPKGHITTTDNIFLTGSFKYEEDLNDFHWVILEDRDEYLGYNVQKAITHRYGRSWIAWFTSELPFNDGPYKFHGLPGLIVKLSDVENHYCFELSSINNTLPNTVIEMEKKDYIITDKMKFFKAEDDFKKGFINNAKNSVSSNDALSRMEQTIKAQNNPLELERK